MPNFVQYGKVGKPIVYNTLPAASEDLKGVCGQVEDKIYICDGSSWNLYSSTTLKKLLDAKKTTYYLFDHYEGTSVDDLIAYNDTENVEFFGSTFSSCFKLVKAPLLNTSKTISWLYTFNQCNSLIDIPLYDTSKVENMNYFLTGRTVLENIPLFNTSNVKKMDGAFRDCKKLSNIPHFDTSNVTTMAGIFWGCPNILTIPLLNTSKVKNMSLAFNECTGLQIVPALDVSNVTNFNSCFSGCTSLKSILMTGMKVSFDIHYSTQFETDDLVTILNNLATVTTSQTLRMGATNLAKLSDEQKKIATDKGWTLA